MVHIASTKSLLVRAIFILVGCFLQNSCAQLTCDPSNDASGAAGTTFNIFNMNRLNAYPNLAAGTCTKLRGNLKIFCQADVVAERNGGQIKDLAWLSNVEEIDGYLHIEDCHDILTLDPLSKLRTIGGSPGKGLYIFACPSLEDVKGLENLRTIVQGGVKILQNQLLCYADLMYWDRITGGGGQVQVLQVSENCTGKTCSSDCHCGFCGGPGNCAQGNCEGLWYHTPGWVNNSEGSTAAYTLIIIFSLVLSVFFVYVIIGCFRKKIKVKVYVSSTRPPPEAMRGFRPIVNRKLNLDAQRRLGSLVKESIRVASNREEESNGVVKREPPGRSGAMINSLDGYSLPGLIEDKDAEDEHARENTDKLQDDIEEEEEEEVDQVTSRPLKPFSNFLHKERNLIESTLVARKNNDRNITAQKVAADLWQGSAEIQTKFKSEYERDFRLFSEYVGKSEWLDANAGTRQEWAKLGLEKKKPYIAAGLEKDKVRRRMQRNARKSQSNTTSARLSRAEFGSFENLTVNKPESIKPSSAKSNRSNKLPPLPKQEPDPTKDSELD